MYYIEDKYQKVIEDFTMSFGGKLDPKNRWVRLAGIMPLDQIEEIYLCTMSTETGRRAFSFRIAFGSIYIKESENLTDEGCVSSWAKEAMTWAVGTSLVNGMGGNQLVPAGSAERAQIATILYRFCENTAG